jgi:hypothetical protein
MSFSPPEIDDEVGVLESAVPPASERRPGGAEDASQVPSRFRRRLERFRSVSSDPDGFVDPEDEAELRLQLVLLREENTRLKAARHQPAGPGTAIDRVRVLSASTPTGDSLDETFSLMGECLALREGLDQVCVEIGAALEGVRDRLERIAAQAEATIAQAEDDARRTA